jgi:hypothetical protein
MKSIYEKLNSFTDDIFWFEGEQDFLFTTILHTAWEMLIDVSWEGKNLPLDKALYESNQRFLADGTNNQSRVAWHTYSLLEDVLLMAEERLNELPDIDHPQYHALDRRSMQIDIALDLLEDADEDDPLNEVRRLAYLLALQLDREEEDEARYREELRQEDSLNRIADVRAEQALLRNPWLVAE